MMMYLCSPAIEQHLKANGFQKTIYVELTARRTFSPNARKQKNPPANPISGSELPVLGNCDGAGAGSDGAGASAGATTAVSDVVSAVSVRGVYDVMTIRSATLGSKAGNSPVVATCCVTTSSGSSVTAVAETFIPGFKENASVGCPSTVNLVPFGILNS